MVRRIVQVACVCLLAISLALMPMRASAYDLSGGIPPGAGGSNYRNQFLTPMIAIVSMGLGLLFASTAESPPSGAARSSLQPEAPDPADHVLFHAMSIADAKNGTTPVWISPAARAAYAANMPVKAAPVVSRPFSDWSGIYFGGDVAYGARATKWTDSFGELAATPGGSFRANGDGALGGLHGGYQFQSGRWILGVEGEISWGDLNAQTAIQFAPAIGFFDSKSDWIASVTGRLGYIVSSPFFGRSAVLYGKAGVAWADFNHSLLLDGFAGPLYFNANAGRANGWTIGGGIEHSLSGNLSFRLETAYYDFGKDTYTFSNPTFGQARIEIDQKVMVSKLGLTYRFGGPSGSYELASARK